MSDEPQEQNGEVRVDRWLWAARFFKTRGLAAEAIDGGKVSINDHRAKRSRPVRVGDRVRLRKGPFEYHLTVTGLADKRGSAQAAALLYEESAASRTAREKRAAEMRAESAGFPQSRGKPSKRQRRQLEKLRRRRPE
jgi:ribosome-associated heat shock protein Hsp15